MDNMRHTFPKLKPGCVVTEVCGVKRDMTAFVKSILPDGITYAGLHPMAGKEVGGFINASPDLFRNAGFIITPVGDTPAREEESAVALLKELSQYAGAGRIIINRPDIHDNIIAYTSDLMHIASAALCYEFNPGMTLTHTAGAFRDCTRVARIDANLWTELLINNREFILPHLQKYQAVLQEYAIALDRRDPEKLHALLDRAFRNKEEILTR
jgi:prephenate dehydrogenase